PAPSRRAAPARRTAGLRAAVADRWVRSYALFPAGAAQVDRPEGAVLAQLEAAGAGEFEGGGEGRGERRAAEHAAAQIGRQKADQLAPLRHVADELPEVAQCLVDRMKRRQRDRQHLGVATAVLLGIGGQ